MFQTVVIDGQIDVAKLNGNQLFKRVYGDISAQNININIT
jgi:hypothetical protein